MKTCAICAFPERCEAEQQCPFEKNWMNESQKRQLTLREKAIASLEAALKVLQRGIQ